MPRYNIQMPVFKGKFNVATKNDAIDEGIRVWKIMIDKMQKNGDIYKVPDICKLSEKHDGLKELGDEVPLKPNKFGKKRR